VVIVKTRKAPESTRNGLGAGAHARAPDLGNGALERGLPRIGPCRGARLGHGAGNIRQRQHAIEGRLDEAVDDGVPIGEPWR